MTRTRQVRRAWCDAARWLLCTLAVVMGPCAHAGVTPLEVASLPTDLTQLSLDDLLKIQVVSVSKKAEPVGEAAAAVFVLSGDDIARSGVHRIADALRMVPGLQVAQPNANNYDISARGFANTGDKLEVLVDGRSVYSPLTSSVFWDVLDTYLPDIERIEVIRGPGATLWGANAVNGVINIVTRSARDTVGAAADVYGGNELRYGGSARLGLRTGDNGALRLYAQGHSLDGAARADNSALADGMNEARAGFRGDWQLGSGSLMATGGGYEATENFNTVSTSGTLGAPVEADRSGGHLLARYECCAQVDGGWSLQASYDGYRVNEPTAYAEQRRTGTLDFQQQWLLGTRHTLIYGAAMKFSRDSTAGPPMAIIFDPAARTLSTYSTFVQDQVSLLDGAGTLTLGSKFEHNSLSGFEVQPGVRFGLKVTPALFSWASISRAVRTPNRIDDDVAIYCPPPAGFPGVCGPGVFRIGNPDEDSEKVVAYEWGARLRTGATLSWDLASFFNDYTHLRSTEPGAALPHFANELDGHGYGAELAVVWKPLQQLELRPWYSYQALHIHQRPGGADMTAPANDEGSAPHHQAGLRVLYEPAPRWNVDAYLRYVSRLAQTSTPSASSGPTSVPAYTELSLRVARQLGSGLELSVAGDNLLDAQHAEFGASASRGELQRSLLLELRWAMP
ncbi:MAG TPA: TonB-dependent receptor plug domain-containing protein [Nevskiaceae bacterium]|nr:TonB-dependent receptor plug domain-containing protein [Nevskiaceae bacterium]